MGLSSSKTTQTNKPIYSSEITGAANAVTGAYNTNAPKIQGYADSIGALIPGMIQKYQAGNPAVQAAQGYITDTLEQDPTSNPYLDQIIAQTGRNTSNNLRASLGTRGITGGTAYQGILAQALAQNEGGMRYTDWNNAMQRRAQAAGMAPGIAAADTIQIAPLLSAASTASGLPMEAASQMAGGVGGLLGQYQTGETKKSGNLFGSLLSLGSSVFSDIRLKENIRHVGQTNGGVPLYSYNYKGDPAPHIGPMAQEVAALQPDALGPEVGGFLTVKYSELV